MTRPRWDLYIHATIKAAVVERAAKEHITPARVVETILCKGLGIELPPPPATAPRSNPDYERPCGYCKAEVGRSCKSPSGATVATHSARLSPIPTPR